MVIMGKTKMGELVRESADIHALMSFDSAKTSDKRIQVDENTEKTLSYVGLRSAKRSKARSLFNKILSIYNYSCAICGWSLEGAKEAQRGIDLHHIIPVREGGAETIENIIPLCPNHHKEADYSLISRNYLVAHLKVQPQDKVEWLKYNYKLNKSAQQARSNEV